MNTVKNYLNEIFGDQVSIVATPEEQMNKLPYYIGSLYTLWKGDLLNNQVYFARYRADELLSPDQFNGYSSGYAGSSCYTYIEGNRKL